MVNRLGTLYRPPLKYHRLCSGLLLRVVVFEGKQERVIRVAGEYAEVLAGGDIAVPVDELVIDAVQFLPGTGNLLFRLVVQLRRKHLAEHIAYLHQPAHPHRVGGGKGGGFKMIAVPNDNLAIDEGIAAVLDADKPFRVGKRFGGRRRPSLVAGCIDMRR